MPRQQTEWVTYQCACGFRLPRVPLTVMHELPRCLGCGRPPPTVGRNRMRGILDVRDLR